ncbi:MAG: two-component system, OmpR family, sensor histidine kinase KdpD [Elusimicrobia bacterium]|nr:MAG: two-component system, OmpR family, sensor histidine kinase KdpD [Elusimicrobiota bacterium]
MVYLLGTLVVALRGRRGPALLSSLLGVLCFDFFFVPPRFTFHAEHPQFVVTFAAMFLVAVLISHLAVGARAQTEAAKRAEVVAETEKLRSSLLSGVSHELRTPLAAIIGSAGALLQAAPGAPPSRDLLVNIRDEAERLARLVHNLIEATRLESGATLKKEPYSVEDVLGTALGRLEEALGERPVTTDLPENLPLVPLDPALLELVFVNLVENAARYGGDGAIDVSARERMDVLEVSVADRGPGLRPEDLGRVFEKFFRASPAPGGAGLGLAICKAVVEAHGGSIAAENRPGGGAVFRFTLPRGEGR